MPHAEKEAQAAYNREYRAKNREALLVKDKARRDANKDKKAITDKAYRDANKEKIAAVKNEWTEANKDKVQGYKLAWQERNKDELRERSRQWRSENPELSRRNSMKWQIANPERRLAITMHNNVIRQRLIGGQALAKFYAAETREIYRNCPEGHHVDHIVPLRGKNVCGLHIPINLQYLPAAENLKKGAKFDGELLPIQQPNKKPVSALTDPACEFN